MKYRKRIYYTEKQKALMWNPWQAGDSLGEIARMFDRGHSSIQGIFAETGGIRVMDVFIDGLDIPGLDVKT